MTLGADLAGAWPKNKDVSRWMFLLLLTVCFFITPITQAVPRRLIVCLDGVAYRDLKALQAGVADTNFWDQPVQRQAFTAAEGYYPVSRMVSTFPSTSDVAWTDIFGDRPLPGYQRTYFSPAADATIIENGVTSSMEHERQMHRQVENGFLRAIAYIYPINVFDYELHTMTQSFWQAPEGVTNFYAYVRASDDAQHMERDIFYLLAKLDRRLEAMRTRYRRQEGRDLEILLISDHGHNHAGRGRRVQVREFLTAAGYRISDTINSAQDVVLPTVGIESWVEVHNWPAETPTLFQKLTHLDGVDLVTAAIPDQANGFWVANAFGERAVIECNPANDSYRYQPEQGDPLHYLPVVAELQQRHQLDTAGFAPAEVWAAATMTNHYPLALERIARAFKSVTLNPATILISLDNRYVNVNWLVDKGSRLVSCGSTHGGLDDINSTGILLSNFTPTHDTTTRRIARQFGEFPGVRPYRNFETGAEWFNTREQTRVRIPRTALDYHLNQLPKSDVFLRVWSPRLAGVSPTTSLQVTIQKPVRFVQPQTRHQKPPPPAPKIELILATPVALPGQTASERVYVCPPDLVLQPQTEYEMNLVLPVGGKNLPLLTINFHTDGTGRPVGY